MGRIRTKFIKHLAQELVVRFPSRFSNDFANNKKTLDELNILQDKSVRNKVAGYVVKVVEKKKI